MDFTSGNFLGIFEYTEDVNTEHVLVGDYFFDKKGMCYVYWGNDYWEIVEPGNPYNSYNSYIDIMGLRKGIMKKIMHLSRIPQKTDEEKDLFDKCFEYLESIDESLKYLYNNYDSSAKIAALDAYISKKLDILEDRLDSLIGESKSLGLLG